MAAWRTTRRSATRELGAEQIYVLVTGTPCQLDEAPRSALAMLIHATGLLVGRRLAQDVAALSDDASVAVLPPPCPLTVQPTDFGQAELLIDEAREHARRYLDRRDRRRLVEIGNRRSLAPSTASSRCRIPPAA